MSLLLVSLSALVAFWFTALAIPQIARVAIRSGWLDTPDDHRKLHEQATPNIGGIAIVGGFLTGILFLLVSQRMGGNHGIALMSPAVWIGALIIVATGFYDDIRGLGFKGKFLVQVVVAYALIAAGYRIDLHGLPFIPADPYHVALYSIPLTLLWVVGVMNAINLIDGIDGLAAGVSTIAFASLAVFFGIHGQPALAVLAIPIIGALLGFLAHNTSPATVFMGDSGSLFLGYALALYSLETQHTASPAVGIVVPIVVLALPLADTALAMLRRASSGRAVFAPDSDHLHHRLVRRYSVNRAVWTLYGVSVLCGVAANVIAVSDVEMGAIVFLASLAAGIEGLRWLGYSPGLYLKRLVFRSPSDAGEETAAVSENAAPRAPQQVVIAGADGLNVGVQLAGVRETVYSGDGGGRAVSLPVPHAGAEREHQADMGEEAGSRPMHQQTPKRNFLMISTPKNMICEQSTVVVADSLTVADLGGEAVILDTQSGMYYGVNEVGTRILDLAVSPVAVSELVEQLQTEYEAAPGRLKEDVLAFLNEMRKAELVSVFQGEQA
ncbi:MAG TPA: PqqD family peptide modification chaperone [Rhodothermales bacterium]|nr:PqqD family peptide modification chaperone [Rhodothermales bacterium]